MSNPCDTIRLTIIRQHIIFEIGEIMYKVTIADIAEMTEEVKRIDINSINPKSDIVSLLLISTKTTITVMGRILCDPSKQFMLDSTKAIASWSMLKPGHDDVYKTVTIESNFAGESQKYEFTNVFCIAYHEWFDEECGFFELVMRPVQFIEVATNGDTESPQAKKSDDERENEDQYIALPTKAERREEIPKPLRAEQFCMLATFRDQNGIEPMGPESKNTVAGVLIDGELTFGKNGRISPETLEQRRNWFEEIQWSPPRDTTPASLNKVQALSHAEANSLLTAREKYGLLPETIEMYVDRPTCPFCIRDLPIIMRHAGIKELRINTLGEEISMVLYAAK
jgi:hypothetical protein